MSDIRWYNEEPQGGGLDVALWHPYSSEPTTRGGNWNFNASPTDLLSLAKYVGGGLKDLLGLGAGGLAASGMPAIMEGSMGGVESLLGPSGALGFAPGAVAPTVAAPSALASALSAYAPATELMGGASFLPAAGAEAIAPAASTATGAGIGAGAGAGSLAAGIGAGVIAPLTIVALAKLLSGNKPYDPTVSPQAQFGTPNPTLQAFQDYLNMPERDRKVDLLAMRGVNGYMGPEYENAWKQEAGRAGLWDLGNNRWNTEVGTGDRDPGPVDIAPEGSGLAYNTLEDAWARENHPAGYYSGWDAFTHSPEYIPEDKRPGYVPPQQPPMERPPESPPVLAPSEIPQGFGGQSEGQGAILAELLRQYQANAPKPWTPRNYNTWQQA